MDVIDLARQVKAVRDAQKSYFRRRHPDFLAECRRMERELDAEVDAILGAAAFDAGGREWADWNAGMLDFGD